MNNSKYKRLAENIMVLNRIRDYLIKYPYIRFGQALWNLGVISRDEKGQIKDIFYEEPGDTLNKILDNTKDE